MTIPYATLKGKTVLVTSSHETGEEECQCLIAAGAIPILIPLIEVGDPPEGLSALDAAIERLSSYAWIVFTSASAVRTFASCLRGRPIPVQLKVAAVGPGTARALELEGISVAVVAREQRAEGLLHALQDRVAAGDRVLWPRARDARAILADGLRARSIDVDEVVAYATGMPKDVDAGRLAQLIGEGGADAALFDSPSAVRHFVELVGRDAARAFARRAELIPIGPVTARAIRDEIGPPDPSGCKAMI